MPTHTPQQGSKLYYSTDGASYTEITEVKDVEHPASRRDGSDDTILSGTLEVDSPSVLRKITQGKFTVYLHQTLYATLKAFVTNGTNPLYWRVTYPFIDAQVTANAKHEWQGWMKSCSPGPVAVGDEKWMCEFEIQRTTDPVFTAGS